MLFSKQIKSLDRRIYVFRKYFSFINRLYNHLSGINVEQSFHNKKEIERIRMTAQNSIDKILEPTQVTGLSKDIPKIIWIYWHTGFAQAPDVVQLAVQSWIKMNEDYEVRLLSDNNLPEYLGFDFNMAFQLSTVRCLLPTKADILRLHLLSKFGGIWVDATTFCLKPLDSWLNTASNLYHIYNFKQKNNITRPIEAWFIAAKQGSPIINDVLKQYICYIVKPRQVSLFVSGKVSLLEKILTNEDLTSPLSPIVSHRAEKYGFMPYFSVAYFFYEALRKHLSKQDLEIYLRQDDNKRMSNNYALTKDPFSEFENANVSKQTYVGSYINSDLYKRRRDMLLQRLDEIN